MVALFAWSVESDQDEAALGYSVASAGDVNADGYDDVIVGVRKYDDGSPNEGRAAVYLGAAGGLDILPVWTTESDDAGAELGFSVALAGDVNGDGYGDVIVGAHGAGEYGEGFASVFFGSASGLETTASWTVSTDQPYAYVGYSVASAGDVNGDGYDDVIVGALGWDQKGGAFVYLGSTTGLETTASWLVEPDQLQSCFATTVASAGDVNGDGYDDVVVGAYAYDNGETDEGRVFVYLGSASGLGTTAAWTAESDQEGAFFGFSVASAGDVNADGFDDIVVGAETYDDTAADEGAAFVFLGSTTGLAPVAAWIVGAGQPDAKFGWSVANAGDVNGDSYDDVLVGAFDYRNGATGEGAAFVYLGSATGPEATPAFFAEGNQTEAEFGYSVASAGDVNGDGYDDIVVGADQFDNGSTDEGRASVYHGQCFGTLDSDADGIGDLCDVCPGSDDGLDADADGLADGCDVCPLQANPGQDDADGDGVGDVCDPCPQDVLNDADGDGFCQTDDCDDTDSSVFGGAPEVCDGKDNACLGTLPDAEADLDGDGVTPCAGDCDDGDPTADPQRSEVCGDRVDNDCDGSADEDCDPPPEAGCGCEVSRGPADTATMLLLAAVLLVRRVGTIRPRN